MKTQVYLMIPKSTPAGDILEVSDQLMQPHRFNPDDPNSKGRFDYRVGALGQTLNDPVAEQAFPEGVRKNIVGNVCSIERLPLNAFPGAVVTSDGAWHDVSDFGWRLTAEPSRANDNAVQKWITHFQSLVAQHPNCWVLETWVHS